MPRVAKQRTTLSGDKAQPIGAVAGQEYGMGQAQMDMQREMPAPNVQSAATAQGAPPGVHPPQAAPPSAGQPTPATAPQVPVDPMQAAAAMPGGPGLFHTPPTTGHVLTAGLKSGPGPGPEIMPPRPVSPLAGTLQLLSQSTGDPFFAQLAQQAGMR